MTKNKKPVLSDHVRKKQRLVTPFVATLGDLIKPFSWAREVTPELIWIGLLVHRYGLSEGSTIAADLCIAAKDTFGDQKADAFTRLSSFRRLSLEQRSELCEKLSYLQLQKLKRGLAPLQKLTTNQPLSFIYVPSADDPVLTEVHPDASQIIDEVSNRTGDLASKAAAAATFTAIAQGKMLMAREMLEATKRDFEFLANPANKEAYRAVGGRFRAGAPALLGVMGPDERSAKQIEWTKEFWAEVGATMNCVQKMPIEYEENDNETAVTKLVVGARNTAKRELDERLSAWKVDLNEVETREVIGALTARQVTLFCDIAHSPNIWTPNTAPTLLRSMADVFINLAWICGDPNTRALEFVNFGLGTKKLEVAHRKAKLETETDQEDIEAQTHIIEMQQAWIDLQRMDQFVEVNLGNWAGSSTRKMAEQAGYLDFYNYVYQPFSECAHSSWAHIGHFNATICASPGHRSHWLPTVVDFEPDPHWLYLAAKYLNKTFCKLDDEMGIKVDVLCTLDFVVESLNTMYAD